VELQDQSGQAEAGQANDRRIAKFLFCHTFDLSQWNLSDRGDGWPEFQPEYRRARPKTTI
jgi:hypothetical protein